MMHDRGSSRAMREVNRSLIVNLLRSGKRTSRAGLAQSSKLTKPTVSSIVDQLIRDGMIREVGLGESDVTGGRPAQLLEFNDRSAAYLGIHFGVHETVVALANARGQIQLRQSRPTIKASPGKAIAAIAPLVDEVLHAAKVPRSRVEAVGATVPGLVDQFSGLCVLAPNLGWRDVPLRDALADTLRMPVVVNNITQASAIAEARVGVAQGLNSFVWIYAGSGVGAGIVIDGQIFVGERGFSGEIGHCQVQDNGPLCGCGRRGCLETVASGMAVMRAVEAAAQRGTPVRGADNAAPLDVAAVAAAARDGDLAARKIFADVGRHLGRGVSYLLNILNPQIVVVGGPVGEAGEVVLRSLRASATRHALDAGKIAVVASTLGRDAEIVGAVYLAMAHAVRSYRLVLGPDSAGRTANAPLAAQG